MAFFAKPLPPSTPKTRRRCTAKRKKGETEDNTVDNNPHSNVTQSASKPGQCDTQPGHPGQHWDFKMK